MNNFSVVDHVTTARSPLRISLAGGGTDIISYASKFEGQVIGFAINKYVSVTIYPRSFYNEVLVKGEFLENVKSVNHLKNLFIYSALKKLKIENNIQISTLSDVPSGTGLGGSAAFLVSLFHAANPGKANKLDLAESASMLEINDLKLSVGKQDHYLASLGGMQLMRFNKDSTVTVNSIDPGPKCLDYFSNRLLLFYTGKIREASKILEYQAQKTSSGDFSVLNSLHSIKNLVRPMLDAINQDSPDLIGPILDKHWKAKSKLSKDISTDHLDKVYAQALFCGADGGKIVGAGGGGFLLLSVIEGKQQKIRDLMNEFRMPEMEFDLDSTGTKKVSISI